MCLVQDWNLLLRGQVCHLSRHQGNHQPQQMTFRLLALVLDQFLRVAVLLKCYTGLAGLG